MSDPTTPSAEAAQPAGEDDAAVQFLSALQPPSRAERSRVFVALLRELTRETRTR